MKSHVSIVTHSSYIHWRYIVEDAWARHEKSVRCEILDLRGYAKQDFFAYRLQRVEQFFPNNSIAVSKNFLKKNGVIFCKINVRKIDKIFINLRAYELSRLPLRGLNEGLQEDFLKHFSTEFGCLDFDLSDIPRKLNLNFFRDYLLGQKLGQLFLQKQKPDTISLSHGRLPIQLGFRSAIQETPISLIGLQQGGTQNKFFAVPNGVHNMEFWRKDLSLSEGIAEATNMDITFENYYGRENHFRKLMTKTGKDLITKPYVVFYTGADGEDAFMLPFESKPYFESESKALNSFYQESLSRNFVPVIRIHPENNLFISKSVTSKREQSIKSNFPKAVVLESNSNVDSYSLGRDAELIASFHSTIGIELGAEGVPMIFFGPTSYSHLLEKNYVRTVDELSNSFSHPPVADLNLIKKWVSWEKNKGNSFKLFSINLSGIFFRGSEVFDGHSMFNKIKSGSFLRNLLQKN